MPFTQEFNYVMMVLVPAGCFMMGIDGGDGAESPASQQCFDRPFWIDQTEVTNDQFRQLRGEAAQESSLFSKGGQQPRDNITWDEAWAFCTARGVRLPTEAEWEYAARGPDNLLYPWGNDFVEGYAVSNSGLNADVGSVPLGVSWVGAYDMSGNVAEWVNSWYGPYPFTIGDSREEYGPIGDFRYRVQRGGASNSTYADAVRSVSRDQVDPSLALARHGFRCARSYY
jgi:formylglycine-generating enzyme required for sulfatase activity